MKKIEIQNDNKMIAGPTWLGAKIFEFPINRDSSYKEKLAKSFRKYGIIDDVKLIKTDLIDGVEKLYIVDGHNRAKTASFMKVNYPVVVLANRFSSKTEIVELVTTINNSQKPWHVTDYIRVYSKIGILDYNQLIELKAGTPYSLYAIAIMCTSVSRTNITELIKSGKFKILRYEEAKRTIEFAKELTNIGRLSNRMLLSLNKVMTLDKFDEEKFKEAFTKYHFSLSQLALDNFDDLFISWLQS